MLPQEKVVAILDSSREDFATFLDLLYGRDVSMELLSMTRLLALSGLEDRFLTHQRRAHMAVAARKITPEDVKEVMDLVTTDHFSKAAETAMKRGLKKQRMKRIKSAKLWNNHMSTMKMIREMAHCTRFGKKRDEGNTSLNIE